MAKFFVGLNFSNEGLLSRKVTGFRKRFDPKYNHYSFPHMSMLAPFEVSERNVDDLVETLKEELDTFFYGKRVMPRLAFTGVGVFEHKRRYLLYLNPSYGADLEYCSEVVLDICRSFIPRTIKYKENKNQFLPLGMFDTVSELHVVLDHAKTEFKNNSDLSIDSISLYENRMGIWVEKEVLVKFEEVNFEEKAARFLQLNNTEL